MSGNREIGPIVKVTKTDEEWKKLLAPAAYQVLRHEDTERAFTSPLHENHQSGIYYCAGCDLPAYSSEQKFDSGTGWPSFWQPIDPKVVELAPFDRIPHMLLPVVTDMKKATLALRWVVDEMERRYSLFAQVGARNITTYNERIAKALAEGTKGRIVRLQRRVPRP